MIDVWKDTLIDWKHASTWEGALAQWLKPYLGRNGLKKLRALGEQDLCYDDSEWLAVADKVMNTDIETIGEALAEDLAPTAIRTYHGCRTTDAGSYHREGIQPNDPEKLALIAREIIMSNDRLKPMLTSFERELENADLFNRDIGRLYVGADDRGLISDCGHYLIYGSEWLLCYLGHAAHPILRETGVPTIIIADLPFSACPDYARGELAPILLREWTRRLVNRSDRVPKLDFSIVLRNAIPAEWVKGHHHPAKIRDPLYNGIMRASPILECPHCVSPDNPIKVDGRD